MRGFVVILLILIYISVIVAQGDVDVPVTSGGARVSSGGGGGSRSPDIENFIRQVESWKTNSPERFDYLKTLLFKQNFTTSKYVAPAVWLYYPSKNKTISRYDPIEIGALVLNTNPIEIRRALYLTMEIQEPGETGFKPAKAATQIIQVNEYNDVWNTSLRVFPDLSSFEYLRQVGTVRLRVNVTDGQYKYKSSIQTNDPEHGYYGDLLLNVSNIPPAVNNTTMSVSPNVAKWDDYIQYTASMEDIMKGKKATTIASKEENPVQVTLYIYNASNKVFNITKPFLPTDPISFSTKDANIFREQDAGKNFTYRYSCTDGIKGGNNTTWTKFGEGPHLRQNPKIKVIDPKADCEEGTFYWWQNYKFGLKVMSLSPDPVNLKVDLYTNTPDHPGKYIASQTMLVPSNNYTEIDFLNVRPFDVADANKTFSYYFGFSAPDQDGKNTIGANGFGLNPKIMPYSIYHPLMLFNLGFMLILIVGVNLLIERKLKRGIKAQESSSGKASRKNGRGGANLGKTANDGIASKISDMIGRKS
jgi:hypothetical protein